MKQLFKIFMAALLIFAGCGNTNQAEPITVVAEPAQVQCVLEVGESSTHNASLSRRMRRTSEASREAAVIVRSMDGMVRGSGTYFTLNGHHIIVTAAHVIQGNPLSYIMTEEGEMTVAVTSYVMNEGEQDLAILLLAEQIESRTPMGLEILTDYSSLVGETLVYTGYPGHHDRMTIFGQVAGVERGHVIVNSYAWPGSSGSAVFDDRGRLVGIVKAIDVNRSPWGPQLTEDIVWLYPMQSIDLSKVTKFLDVYEILMEEQSQ